MWESVSEGVGAGNYECTGRVCMCEDVESGMRRWVCPCAEEAGAWVQSLHGVGWRALPGIYDFQGWTPPGRATAVLRLPVKWPRQGA